MKIFIFILFFSFQSVYAKKSCRIVTAEGQMKLENNKKYFVINKYSESELRFELKTNLKFTQPFYKLSFQIYRQCLKRDCKIDQVKILKFYSDYSYTPVTFSLYDLDRGPDQKCK